MWQQEVVYRELCAPLGHGSHTIISEVVAVGDGQLSQVWPLPNGSQRVILQVATRQCQLVQRCPLGERLCRLLCHLLVALASPPQHRLEVQLHLGALRQVRSRAWRVLAR